MGIYYRKGFKYQLAEDYSITIKICPVDPIVTDYIELNSKGLLTIHKGYAWDGASGTTIDTKSSMRGALVHDAIYQLLRMEKINITWRTYADELLRDLCIEDGMWKCRAKAWYKAVEKLAGFAADPKNVKEVIET